MQSADTATSSDTERRLPSNAHRQPSPQSIRRDSASIARATDRLASTPPSLPRSLHLEEAMDKSVAARRLRRHLVTRPQTDADDGYNGDTNDNEDDVDDGASATGTNMPVDPLTLPSGDVTYGIYRWHQTHGESDDRSAGRRRRGSFSGAPSDGEWGVPYTQRQIAAPGGFRRQFVQERALQQGRAANILTENFVDFIGLYGHFAGEDYPSDEDDDDAEQEVGEQAPLLRQPSMRSLQATASNKKAFFLLLKAFVGTGVLVLPKAFSNGGLLASIVMMLFVAWYAWHCMVILGDVYLHVGGSYSELGAKLFGRWASRIITVSVLLAQIGFCSAYTIFVATNLRDLWNALTSCQYNYSPTFWVLAQLLAYIPLSWVRRIKQFAPFALAANIFIMLGLAYVLVYDVAGIATRGPADIVQYNPLRFPLLVGTAVFAFEGVTLVIPVIDSMAHKERFPTILTAALGVCIVVFVSIGALSYISFGDAVETVILLNLPPVAPTFIMQLLYSVAIMLSVPLQLYPAVRILESGAFPRSGKGNPVVKWQKNVFRTMVVGVVACVSIFGADQLDNFIAIIGAFSCTPLSFIYPAALHYRINQGRRWIQVKDVVLALIGFVILIYVTYIGIISWGNAPPTSDKCASTQP
ncbi:hypothetical protein LPJ64_004477 [Coemansia asiatica]|uniref:Amino acid transporter transmembrane domain-containing protein n=1 Tax=Coemansia asiatica TaxID=1052880 RepID=A0A9W7XJL5_9FUNG|nr:hypothetical protein LPJ64_004477 [Coemansia asiatica]